MKKELRPSAVRLSVGRPDGFPRTDPPMESVSISVENPDPLDFDREALRAAINNQIYGKRSWDIEEHWSEHEWGASGPYSYVIDLLVNEGLDAVVLALIAWLKARSEPTYTEVTTPEEATGVFRRHLKDVHGIENAHVSSCEAMGPRKWRVEAEGGGMRFDGVVEAEHLLIVRVENTSPFEE